MPVTTRSQTRTASARQNAEPLPSSKRLAKTTRKASRTTATNGSIQNAAISKKPRRAKPTLPSSKKPPKRSSTRQASDQKKQSLTATVLSSPGLSNPTLTRWPCQSCSCPQGDFDDQVDSCIRCGHPMDDHEDFNHPWAPECDFVCKRSDLVDSILQLVRSTRLVVIHATPQVGKTTLLRLLGRHILYEEKDLEPVFISLKHRHKRDFLPYRQYLQQEKSRWQEDNAKYRPRNPEATAIYLIDEAQDPYEEERLWSQTFKNPDATQQSMFVLVSLCDSVGTSLLREPAVESQALRMDRFERVELRPSVRGRPYMLFKPEETAITVQKWAIQNKLQLKGGVSEYLHVATDGHPGMVGLILQHFQNVSRQFAERRQPARQWSPELCHKIIVEDKGLLEWFVGWVRGVWIAEAETCVKQYRLGYPSYNYIPFSEVAEALREVATKPHDHTRIQKGFDAFAVCDKMGFLHSEQPRPGSIEVTYLFASPIHRRIAYRLLCAGPKPGSRSPRASLQQICQNAIERLSPAVLQSRNDQGIPEAAFQDELYCCLIYELRSLPILSDHSHTKDGRIDFYVFDQKWGIEVLQSRSKADIIENARRFQTGGKYQEWNILDDYAIINFCSKSALQEFETEDSSMQSRILQIVVDPKECTAEVYTHDKQLQVTSQLGEGRQRYQAEDIDQSSNSATGQALQDELIQKDREIEEIKRTLFESKQKAKRR